MLSKYSQTREGRNGIGLYTYEQIKNVTAFQYFAQLLVGLFVSCMGAFLLYYVMSIRSDEIRKYGAPEGHFWGWLGGVSIIVSGLFTAHAGAIFYLRKITRYLRSSRKPK